MLAIGRALLTQPAILILDEATEGLAPLVRLDISRTVEAVKSQGQSVLVIDRDLDALARVCDQFAVLEKGRIARQGEASELTENRQGIQAFLGV